MDFPRLSIFSLLPTPSFASTIVPSLNLNTQVSLHEIRGKEAKVRQKKKKEEEVKEGEMGGKEKKKKGR